MASASPQSRPSTAARARCAGVQVSRVRPCSEAVACGRSGVRSPSKYGHQDRAAGARRGGQGEVGEAGVVDAEQPRGGVEHPRRVERGDQRQEAAGGVGEAGDDAGGVGRRDVGDARRRRPRCRSRRRRRRARAPGRARRPRCRRCPARAAAPPASRAGAARSARATRGSAGVVAEGELEQVAAVVAGGRRPVAGAAGVAAVGDQVVERRRCREPPGQPVVGQADGGRAGGRSGSWSREPAQLGDREGRDRAPSRPRRPTPSGPPSSAMRSVGRAGRAGVVPQQRRRGPPAPASSRQTMPCCWPPTATAATSSSPPAAPTAVSSARHQAGGVDLGAVGVAARGPRGPRRRCRRRRTTTLQDCVEESTPATRRATGQPRTPYRCSSASWSRRSKAIPRAAGLVGVERLGAEVGERLAGVRASGRRAGRRGRRAAPAWTSGSARKARDLLAQDQVVAHAAGGRGPHAVHVLGARRLEVEVPRAVVAAVLQDVDGPERAAGVAGAEAEVLVVAGAGLAVEVDVEELAVPQRLGDAVRVVEPGHLLVARPRG